MPELDGKTTKAVSLQTLLDALAPRDFLTFASPKTLGHSALTGFGVLEGQPHNRVHNCVGGIFTDPKGNTTNNGGFMQANLSPVDPLFFLHHANIDRLWDVWTRKQLARGYPALPEGADLDAWSREPFLFFVDAKGKPVKKRTAGDYAAIGDFNYDYEPGSGEEVVAPPMFASLMRTAVPSESTRAQISRSVVSGEQAASAIVTLPSPLLGLRAQAEAPQLYAKITLALPPLAHHHDFAVMVDDGNSRTDPSSPHYVGTLSMFGHHTIQAPVTFTVPLSGTIEAMRQNAQLADSGALNIRIVSERMVKLGVQMAGHAPGTEPKAEVLSVVVEAH
ncbi:tyrosinase family protein [Nitrosospira multiformis]|uniref:tyrosinase family protein n=1 Tax=Nitrosospira multiformis TaxID=1231 RepID=UPI0020C90D6A|nr:tyrosinase family protein [Nitrosospira multiformis]